MKVTKKITTTVIGEVAESEIKKHMCRDFNNGKYAKKAFNRMQKDGFKVFIDSVTTEKCVLDIPDGVVFANASITRVEKKDEEKKG